MIECRDQLDAEQGLPTSYLRLRAYPFTADLEAFIARHDRVYVVEQNRDGQLLALMRQELDAALLSRLRSVRHYNGLPIDARSITDEIVAHEAHTPLPPETAPEDVPVGAEEAV
jgi:2-oxoglutarate ferredoxin oxidoreductase subunit alpha